MRGRQIEQRQRAGAKRFDLGERFLVPVADAAGGTNPDRAGIFHHGQQRRSQPARHGLIGLSARHTI
jgi:hypothetical protein